MGKLLYIVYALIVVSVMSGVSFSRLSQSSSNINSFYHGSSLGSGGGGGGGGGHK